MADLVRFEDGVMVEIAGNPNRTSPIAGKEAERAAIAFQSATDVMGAAIRAVVNPLQSAIASAGAVEAELEIGIGFSVEGNAFITKVTGEGNIVVRVKVNGQAK